MRFWIVILVVLLGGLWIVGELSRDRVARDVAGLEPQPTTQRSPSFVGRASCVECHPAEHARWTDSHHDLAMQPATQATVLGDFDDASFVRRGLSSRFSSDADHHYVETQGADGESETFEIAYAIGVTPLQQYLVALPDGRYQVLRECWDTRPANAGGQRWFELNPGEPIPPGDPLHWTGRLQNWNYMCAACHTTGLRNGFDLAGDRYETTWEELDVSCETCHGPASAHLAWAADGASADTTGDLGLSVRLKDTGEGFWTFTDGEPTAQRSAPRSLDPIQACARCHARGSALREPHEPGRPLLDTHRLSLLDEGLYHADGQIQDEVYVYGSFLQSKMARGGVVCSDCHDPHGLDVLVDGNALCARCHVAEVFDTPTHHGHEPRTPGAACVDCHMPETTFMVVDPRRDHSLRVPRPDLSVKLGTPNACNACHTERSAAWAAAAIDRWHPGERAPHFATALAAGRSGRPGARVALIALAEDAEQPAIARATALKLLNRVAGPPPPSLIDRALLDDDALVRAAAVESLEGSEPSWLATRAVPALSDRARLVRIEAAHVLAALPETLLPPDYAAAVDELIASELANADQPQAHVNLGNFRYARGDLAAASAAFETALRLDPGSIPAAVNLAELRRKLAGDAACERVLEEALGVSPDAGDLHYALGLLRIRQGRRAEALEAFAVAARQRPDTPRYAYTHALALQGAEQSSAAVSVLEAALSRHPHDRELLYGLTTLWRDLGETERALEYARRLTALSPDDLELQALVDELR